MQQFCESAAKELAARLLAKVIKRTPVGVYPSGSGMVGGTSYSGDTQLASVNSGELILNKAQQNSLANELQSGNAQPLRLSARMSGTDILFAINTALAAEGKGQLITLR